MRKVLRREGGLDTMVVPVEDVTDHCRAPERWRARGFENSARGRSRLWLGAIAEGELDDVIADIVGPAGDETDESPPVIGEQCPRGLLEACKIAGHDGHETIGGIPRRPGAIRIAIGTARF